jgi:hypothetical protein
MTRKHLRKITRRFTVVLALGALAVPATAAAHPSGDFGGGGNGGQKSAFVPSDPGQNRVLRGESLPTGVVLRKSGPAHQGPQAATVTVANSTATGSSFDWNDALIGAGITAAVMTLAMGGALVARRQGRLGYR